MTQTISCNINSYQSLLRIYRTHSLTLAITHTTCDVVIIDGIMPIQIHVAQCFCIAVVKVGYSPFRYKDSRLESGMKSPLCSENVSQFSMDNLTRLGKHSNASLLILKITMLLYPSFRKLAILPFWQNPKGGTYKYGSYWM